MFQVFLHILDPFSNHQGPKGNKRPDTRHKCVVTLVPAQSDQSVAVGNKSGVPGVLRSLSLS